MTKRVNLYSVFFSLKVSFFFYMSNEECIPFSQYIWKAFILHFQMNVEAVYKYWLSCTKKFNIRFEEKYFCKKIDFGSMILLPKLSSIIRYLLHATFYVASYLYYLQSRDITTLILITITYILSSFTLFKHWKEILWMMCSIWGRDNRFYRQ